MSDLISLSQLEIKSLPKKGIPFGGPTGKMLFDVNNFKYDKFLKSLIVAGIDVSNLTVKDITVTGKAKFNITTVTSDYTVTIETVILCDASTGKITITLPPVSTSTGILIHIKKIDSSSNTVVIDGYESETIDNGATAILTTQYEAIGLACNKNGWWIV